MKTITALLIGSTLLLSASSVDAAKTKLTIWYPTGPIATWQKVAFPEFERQYDVEIDAVSMSWAEAKPKALAAFATGTTPDIFVLGNGGGFGWGSSGLLADLSPFLSTWPDYDKVPAPTWATNKWQGRVYMLPVWLDLRTMAYRKDLFAANGLDPNQPPTSWDAMLADVKKLTREQDGKLTQVGYTTGWTGYINQRFVSYVRQSGGRMYDENRKHPLFTEPAGVEAANFMVQLYQITHPAGVPGFGGDFNAGTAAITVASNGTATRFKAQHESENLGVFVSRKDPQSAPIALTYINGMGIGALSPHPELAWKLITFLTSPAMVKYEIDAGMGSVLARRDVAQMALDANPEFQPFYDATQYIAAAPPTDASLQIALSDELRNAFTNKKPVAAALADAAKQWQVSLDDWWADH